MSEVDPDPYEPGEGQGSELGGPGPPGDPTDGGKRGEIGEAPSIAADEPDADGSRYPVGGGTRRRGAGRPAGRRPRPGRLNRERLVPPAARPVATAASVLAEAADARATVVLSGHVQPDADALGSTLALAEGLRRRGARVLTTFPDPFTLPDSLGWLPGAEGLVPSSTVPVLARRLRQPGRRLAGPAR